MNRIIFLLLQCLLFQFILIGCKSKFDFKNKTVYLVTNREKSSFKNQFRDHVGDQNVWLHVHTNTGKYKYEEQSKENYFNSFFKKLNGNDLIVYIHGSGKSIKTVTKRSIRISSIYKKPVVAFDWATHKTPGPLIYRKSRAMAKKSATYLNDFLKELFEYKNLNYKHVKIHLFLHSLGNHVFESLVALEGYNPKEHPFENIIFSAADIIEDDQKVLFEKLKKFKSNVFIFFNKGDFVLWWAELFIWKSRLGKNVARSIDDKHIHFIDLSNADKVGHRHEYLFHPSKNLLQFINNILNDSVLDKNVFVNKNENIWTLK
ncbi:MAG: hypothetical protein COA79_06135 [Planctomycetota bacterium]|nr:MAG: hypothetical protein COA79_06135 [Planctomycetota bacterium]